MRADALLAAAAIDDNTQLLQAVPLAVGIAPRHFEGDNARAAFSFAHAEDASTDFSDAVTGVVGDFEHAVGQRRRGGGKPEMREQFEARPQGQRADDILRAAFVAGRCCFKV